MTGPKSISLQAAVSSGGPGSSTFGPIFFFRFKWRKRFRRT